MGKFIIIENFKVYKSLYDEASEGWIWVNKKFIDKTNKSKVIRITNLGNENNIVCHVRSIDDDYSNKYKTSTTNTLAEESIILNEHYRTKLGFIYTEIKGKDCKLSITNANFKDKYWNYFLDHPNSIINLTHKLVVISIGIGILSIALTIIGLFLTCYPNYKLIYCIAVIVGFLIIGFLALLDKIFNE